MRRLQRPLYVLTIDDRRTARGPYTEPFDRPEHRAQYAQQAMRSAVASGAAVHLSDDGRTLTVTD